MGGLFSSNTSKSSSPTTVSNDPWVGAQPGLNALYGEALNQFYRGPAQAYPNQTVANPSADTQHAQNLGSQLGSNSNINQYGVLALDQGQMNAANTGAGQYLNSDPSMGGASMFGSGAMMGNTAGDSQLSAIGNGAMLYGNPYMDAMFNHTADQVGQQYSKSIMPGIASMFAGAGRYGTEGMANGMGQAQQQYGNQINGLASSMYGANYANERNLLQQALTQMNNTGLAERGQQLSGLNMLSGQYQNERNRMMQASGMAPELAQADWNDVNNLGRIGATRDVTQQNMINADKANWDAWQKSPWTNLNNLASIMGTASPYGQKNSSGGETTESKTPSLFNMIMGGLGIASGAGAFGSSVALPSVW